MTAADLSSITRQGTAGGGGAVFVIRKVWDTVLLHDLARLIRIRRVWDTV